MMYDHPTLDDHIISILDDHAIQFMDGDLLLEATTIAFIRTFYLPVVIVPTIDMIATAFVDVKLFRCSCLAGMSREQLYRIVFHCLTEWCIAPPIDCNYIISIQLFLDQEHRLPTADEFITFIIHLTAMGDDPEGYHATHRVVIPTPNLNQLPIIQSETISVCAICQDTIYAQSTMYHMPCCKKHFHAVPSECLVNRTVKDWLLANSKCPACNMDVIITTDGSPI